jgi:hypothetical protein
MLVCKRDARAYMQLLVRFKCPQSYINTQVYARVGRRKRAYRCKPTWGITNTVVYSLQSGPSATRRAFGDAFGDWDRRFVLFLSFGKHRVIVVLNALQTLDLRSIYFTVYNNSKQIMAQGGESHVWHHVTSAVVAGAVGDVFCNPFWVRCDWLSCESRCELRPAPTGSPYAHADATPSP